MSSTMSSCGITEPPPNGGPPIDAPIDAPVGVPIDPAVGVPVGVPIDAPEHCTFCSIAEGDAPALRIYEDDHAVAFMDRLPMTPGHCLVIPRRHVRDVWDLTDDDAAHVMGAAARVARLLRERLQPLGVNLLNNNGAAADQTQFHFHIHVIPRYGRDKLLRPWERMPTSADEIEASYRRLAVPAERGSGPGAQGARPSR